MDSLNKLLELWRKDKSIENIIESGIIIDESTIQAFLKKVSEEEKNKLSTEMSEMAQALQDFIKETEITINDIKIQLDSNKNNTKACLSYTSAGILGNKNKRDE